MNVLLVGPLTPPVHGQSLAFTRFVESINEEKVVINTNLEEKTKFSKVLRTLKTLVLSIVNVLFTKYDVVYFTCSRSFLGSIKDIVLINLVSLRKVRIINHLHGSDFYEFLHSSPKWYQNILFKSYEKVDMSIVLLDSMKDQFIDFANMRVEVVPNFYDNELNDKIIEKEDDKINLLYLSNIMSSKGIFELIEAFKILSKRYDNLYLTIAGGYIGDQYMNVDTLKEKFNAQIAENNRIKYIGKVFGKEKVKLLQGSDIFVLPSYYKSEAFPISIIEAMACANAIVTTNYKYLPDVVNEQNGMLVEPKSVKSLMNGLESLLNDEEKLQNIQVRNKQEAVDKYNLDKYIENLKKIVLEGK